VLDGKGNQISGDNLLACYLDHGPVRERHVVRTRYAHQRLPALRQVCGPR
jgi:hypothetical protein